MSLSNALSNRCNDLCELCSSKTPTNEWVVSPRKGDVIEDQVALCDTCLAAIGTTEAAFHWHCLEGSIWNPEPAVQAMSYRILQNYSSEEWAQNIINNVDLDESVVEWALSGSSQTTAHIDAFGNKLENGDNVVLTQALNVKGTNFTASKGTVVKRIRLVSDNATQIEGKINDQTIVILTQFVKKSL